MFLWWFLEHKTSDVNGECGTAQRMIPLIDGVRDANEALTT